MWQPRRFVVPRRVPATSVVRFHGEGTVRRSSISGSSMSSRSSSAGVATASRDLDHQLIPGGDTGACNHTVSFSRPVCEAAGIHFWPRTNHSLASHPASHRTVSATATPPRLLNRRARVSPSRQPAEGQRNRTRSTSPPSCGGGQAPELRTAGTRSHGHFSTMP